MICFCDKLRGEDFSHITKNETEVLRRVFSKAPHLFIEKPRGATPASKATRLPPKIISPRQNTQLKIQPNPSPSGSQHLQKSLAGLGTIYQDSELFKKSIEISQRVKYYAWAKIHERGNCIDIIQDLIWATEKNIERKHVYHYLRLGKRWDKILGLFASIVGGTPNELTGIFYMLRYPSSWERASLEDCKTVLVSLNSTKRFHTRAKDFAPSANATIDQIFSKLTPKLIHSIVDFNGTKNLINSVPDRGLHTALDSTSHKIFSSISAVSKEPPDQMRASSKEAKLLLVFLSFLARTEVPLLLCVRGATPRKRWNRSGEIEETDAVSIGLAPELVELLSNKATLKSLLNELEASSMISEISRDTWLLNEWVPAHVFGSLPFELRSFWRHQALIVALRSIPWKYVEPDILVESFLSHIQHTVQGIETHDGFQQLAPNTRTELVLTLVEASRFPGIAWKKFAINRAREAVHGLYDEFLQYSVEQRECLLSRITGDTIKTINVVNNFGRNIVADKKAHSGFGHTVIQHALNCIQNEDLTKAKDTLNMWQPLSQPPSSIEAPVLVRKHTMLGKILRFQGQFKYSLENLDTSKSLIDHWQNLFFSEDRYDLAVNRADTIRELGAYVEAESYLRMEIRYQNQNSNSDRCLLKLALAESLFPQQRHAEAIGICKEVQSHSKLRKMEKLRLAITLAKLFHTQGDWEKAFEYWTEAMCTIKLFPLANGHTTQLILLSICDILYHKNQREMEHQTFDQLTALKKLAGSGDGALYWIAGLRQWSMRI